MRKRDREVVGSLDIKVVTSSVLLRVHVLRSPHAVVHVKRHPDLLTKPRKTVREDGGLRIPVHDPAAFPLQVKPAIQLEVLIGNAPLPRVGDNVEQRLLVRERFAIRRIFFGVVVIIGAVLSGDKCPRPKKKVVKG